MKISTLIAIYITVVFCAFIMLKIYEKYTTNKIKFDKKLIIKVVLISILTFLNNVFMLIAVRAIVSTLLTFLLFKIIYKDNIKKTIYYTLIISITLFCVELILTLFLPLGIKNIEILNESMVFKVVYSFAVNICQYLILTNKYVIRFFKKIEISLSNNKIYYILGIIGIFTCNVWVFYFIYFITKH